MRKPIIAGNWKMNKTPEEAKALVSDLIPLVKDAKCDVVVCPPFVDLCPVSSSSRAPTSAWAARTSIGPRAAPTPARSRPAC